MQSATQSSDSSRPLHFQSKDGTKLFATLYPTAQPARANALIVHGYGDHGGPYYEVARELNEIGLNALCLDLRGHGRSHGERGFIASFEEYLEDVEAALALLSEQCEDLEVLLVGHSNGGLIAMRLLADPFRCPKSIRAAVLSSPFLSLKIKAPAKSLFAQVASRVLPKLSLPHKIEAELLSHDPEKIREHNHDTLGHDVVSTRWFTEMSHAQRWVAEYAHRVTVPTLWLVSGLDEIAGPEQTRRVHARLKSESEYHEFPDMHHEVFNEVDRAKVFGLMKDFCSQKFHL